MVSFTQLPCVASMTVPFEAIESINNHGLTPVVLKRQEESVWVGTLNGLAKISPGNYSVYSVFTGHLKANHISGITVDAEGTVWASTLGGGIFFLNEKRNTSGLLQEEYSFPLISCSDIESNDSGTKILFICDNNLYLYSKGNDSLIKVRAKELSDIELYTLQNLTESSFLIGTWGSGVFRLELEDLSVVEFFGKAKYINSLNISYDREILISSTDGAFILKENSDRVKKISKLIEGLIWEEDVSTIHKLDRSSYLISFPSHGLFQFNNDTGELSRPKLLKPMLEQEPFGDVTSIIDIEDGKTLVFGAGEYGLYILPFDQSFIEFFENSTLKESEVTTLVETKNVIYIGDDSSFYVINPQLKKITKYIQNVGLTYFIEEYDGGVLVSSYEKGLQFSRDVSSPKLKKLDAIGLPKTPESRFSAFLKLSDDTMILGTDFGQEKGLYVGSFTGGFKRTIEDIVVLSLFEISGDRTLVFTAYNGIFVLNNFSGNYTKYPPLKPGLYSDCIEQLNEHQFLICVRRNKAQIFDLNTKTYSDFEPGSVEIRNVRTAELDAYGNLWLASSRGLYVYNMNSEELTKVTEAEGVFSTEFSSDMSLLLDDGTLILPGNKGVIAIDTAKANAYFQEKRQSITKSLITRVNYILADQSEHRPVLSHITENSLILPHDNIVLRIQLSHNNLLEASQLGYETRLLGLTEEWEALEIDKHSASYTTMQPGEYEFQARVVDPRSMAEQPIVSLSVTVLPPWWKTTWAYFAYLALLLALIYFISWYRNKRLLEINEQLTLKVAQRTETISQLLKQKQAFFANVSHEFRTPLTLISGPLDAIAEKIESPQEHKLLEIARRNTQRLLRLVDQILDLAKLETSRSLPKQVYDLNDSIQVITASFAALLERNHQTLTVSDIPPVRINVIEDSFEMIVTNLLSNAVKYSGENTKISLDIRLVEQQLELEIRDNGKGISKENQAILFERFTRFDAGENIEGSGIGLALVKQLVISNDGKITVESDVGCGTAFKIVFPSNVISDGQVTQTTHLPVLEVKPDIAPVDCKTTERVALDAVSEQTLISDKHKILVVDDNTDIRDFICDSLCSEYEVDTAVDGKDGFSKAMLNIPDLILSDVIMPEMDGYELANAIRNDHATSHIPLVLLTAKGDDLSRMKGWEENVDDYLTKPFNLKELRMRIQRLLSIRDILRKKHTADLSNKLATKNQEAISFQTKRDKEFFNRFEMVIGKHYQQEHFTRAEAASELAMSERQLNRKLSALVDYNFSEYLRKYRLQKSKELLLSGKQVTEVAYDVGFSSPSYFSSCFKAEFEQTPKEFVEVQEQSGNGRGDNR